MCLMTLNWFYLDNYVICYLVEYSRLTLLYRLMTSGWLMVLKYKYMNNRWFRLVAIAINLRSKSTHRSSYRRMSTFELLWKLRSQYKIINVRVLFILIETLYCNEPSKYKMQHVAVSIFGWPYNPSSLWGLKPNSFHSFRSNVTMSIVLSSLIAFQ